MARRRGHRADIDNSSKEGQGQVDNKKKGQGGEPPEWMRELFRRGREEDKVLAAHPRHAELRRQRIRLKDNGAEMEWGEAQRWVESQRRIQAAPELAEAWETLLALVKPRGAAAIPSKVTPEGLESLMRMGHVEDGSVHENYAKVLDASLTVTNNGEVVLRDPVAYTREFDEEWGPVDRRVQSELARLDDRLAAEQAERERRRRRGQTDDGPSL